jgi:hypothetical protein
VKQWFWVGIGALVVAAVVIPFGSIPATIAIRKLRERQLRQRQIDQAKADAEAERTAARLNDVYRAQGADILDWTH